MPASAGRGVVRGLACASPQPADGYTLLMAPTSYVLQAVLDKTVRYDVFKSFAPVALLATGTLVLAVSDATPAKTVKEFVALAKSKPGELTYGSPGNGTPHHLAMELFKLDAGINVLHVPFK